MGQTVGKRVAICSRGRKKWTYISIIAIAFIVVGYIVLCVFSSNDKYLPNTFVSGINISGQSKKQAVQAIEDEIGKVVSTLSVSFECGNHIYEIHNLDIQCEISDLLDQILVDQQGVLTRGWKYLRSLACDSYYFLPVVLKSIPADVMEATEDVSYPAVQSTWEIQNDLLVIQKGISGQDINTAKLVTDIESQVGEIFSKGESSSRETIEAELVAVPPDPLDIDAIHDEIYTEPANAFLSIESRDITESVSGIDFDTKTAKDTFNAADEGAVIEIPLELTEPKITTALLKDTLFQDILGEAVTICDGPSNRWDNITLASDRLNGTILLPGEEFSYNTTVGPYTIESGYKKAGGYVGNKHIDTTAGGICQLSSTLYWCCLRANLNITERHQHRFNGGYMPVVGTDATVYDDLYDFKFLNSTDSPVMIKSYMDSGYKLHVTIYGTNTTGVHGEPYSNIISTVPYKNTYRPNESIPLGSNPIRDPEYARYNGITVDVYQKLTDSDGNVLSTNFLYRNTYQVSNAVYYYNPSDAARLGIDPSTGLRTLTPVTTEASAQPESSASPSQAVEPSVQPESESSAAPSPAAEPPVQPESESSAAPSPTAEPPVQPESESSAAPSPAADPTV